MAFLCNEDKFFWVKNLPSTEQISPGYYIPQSIQRKVKRSYFPFGSNVQKETKKKYDYIPLNHSKNIYLFNFEKNKNKTNNNQNSQDMKGNLNTIKTLKIQDDIPGEEVKKNYLIINNYKKENNANKKKIKKHPKIIIDSKNSEKLKNGQNAQFNNNFNCMICCNDIKNNMNNKKYKKEKSLKEIDKNRIQNENLINEKNIFPRTMTENWYSKIRTKYNNELLLEFERDKNLNKNAFISSIPYKAHSYGYIIEDNGAMTPKENPDALKIFSGLGKDTVGPGNYDINLKWNKTLSLWSKSKTKRFSSKRKNVNMKKEFEKNMIEKDKYSKTYSSNEWFNKDKYKNSLNKYNFKFISLAGTKESILTPSGGLITNSFEKPGRTDKFFINKLNVLYPGPGYYYEDDKWSCLKIVRYPGKKKKRFNFGSNVNRFDLMNEEESGEENKFEDPKEAYRKKLKEIKEKTPLPTTYFKEDLKRTHYLKEKFKCPQKTFYFKHIW